MHTETDIFVSDLMGKRYVGDPFRIARRYACYEQHDPVRDAKLLKLKGKAAADAQDRIIAAARAAFDLPEATVDEQGNVTGFDDWYVFCLLDEFSDYCVKKKLSFESQPTSPKSTASKSSTPRATGRKRAAPASASIVELVTNAHSVSGSTPAEPSSDGPPPSSSASV